MSSCDTVEPFRSIDEVHIVRQINNSVRSRSYTSLDTNGTVTSDRMGKSAEEGSQVEMSYVTERIIALSFSPTVPVKTHRSQLSKILRLLRQQHSNAFLNVNLSTEAIVSDQGSEERTLELGWPDNLAPPLQILCTICRCIEFWLTLSDDHVVVLHSKGGRGRLGCVISAFLNYVSFIDNEELQKELNRFAIENFYEMKLKRYTHPSQRRFALYLKTLMSEDQTLPINEYPLYLHEVVVKGFFSSLYPPNSGNVANGESTQQGSKVVDIANAQCRPFFKIYVGLRLVRVTPVYKIPQAGQRGATSNKFRITFDPPIELHGDVLIKCFHKHPRRPLVTVRDALFSCQFHTSATGIGPAISKADTRTQMLKFFKRDLDEACYDPRCGQGFAVELILSTNERRPSRSEGSRSQSAFHLTDYERVETIMRADSYEDFSRSLLIGDATEDDEYLFERMQRWKQHRSSPSGMSSGGLKLMAREGKHRSRATTATTGSHRSRMRRSRSYHQQSRDYHRNHVDEPPLQRLRIYGGDSPDGRTTQQRSTSRVETVLSHDSNLRSSVQAPEHSGLSSVSFRLTSPTTSCATRSADESRRFSDEQQQRRSRRSQSALRHGERPATREPSIRQHRRIRHSASSQHLADHNSYNRATSATDYSPSSPQYSSLGNRLERPASAHGHYSSTLEEQLGRAAKEQRLLAELHNSRVLQRQLERLERHSLFQPAYRIGTEPADMNGDNNSTGVALEPIHYTITIDPPHAHIDSGATSPDREPHERPFTRRQNTRNVTALSNGVDGDAVGGSNSDFETFQRDVLHGKISPGVEPVRPTKRSNLNVLLNRTDYRTRSPVTEGTTRTDKIDQLLERLSTLENNIGKILPQTSPPSVTTPRQSHSPAAQTPTASENDNESSTLARLEMLLGRLIEKQERAATNSSAGSPRNMVDSNASNMHFSRTVNDLSHYGAGQTMGSSGSSHGATGGLCPFCDGGGPVKRTAGRSPLLLSNFDNVQSLCSKCQHEGTMRTPSQLPLPHAARASTPAVHDYEDDIQLQPIGTWQLLDHLPQKDPTNPSSMARSNSLQMMQQHGAGTSTTTVDSTLNKHSQRLAYRRIQTTPVYHTQPHAAATATSAPSTASHNRLLTPSSLSVNTDVPLPVVTIFAAGKSNVDAVPNSAFSFPIDSRQTSL